jgi:hypothetical protein
MGMISKILNKIAGRPDPEKMAQMADEVQQRHLDYKPFTYSNQNAQSWNPETHPEGRGPSHLVATIDYEEDTGNLDVGYRDGFQARYKNISPDLVQRFNDADSKGRFAQKNLFNRPYEEL